MAKEADLKKIELKVSVICCDGCKRKVKKALQSVEVGVLKTETDASHTKVKVLGNVDPQLLIKKLSKAGKQAKLLSHVPQKSSGKQDKEEEMRTSKKEKHQWECKPTGADASQKTNRKDSGWDTNEKKTETERDNGERAIKTTENATAWNYYCRHYGGYAVVIPCYASPSYSLHYDAYQYPPAPVLRVGDYFSEDNSVGCYIM